MASASSPAAAGQSSANSGVVSLRFLDKPYDVVFGSAQEGKDRAAYVCSVLRLPPQTVLLFKDGDVYVSADALATGKTYVVETGPCIHTTCKILMPNRCFVYERYHTPSTRRAPERVEARESEGLHQVSRDGEAQRLPLYRMRLLSGRNQAGASPQR